MVDQIGSTSTELLRRAQRRDIHGAVLAAEWQTAGRGRRGKPWTAVAGGSLTFSLGWRYEQGAGFLAGLSLAVGVAVVRALEAEGLAASSSSGRTTSCTAISRSAASWSSSMATRSAPRPSWWASASTCACPSKCAATSSSRSATYHGGGPRRAPLDRNRLLARLAAELAMTLDAYSRAGFPAFAAEWQRRHAYQGKPVKLLLPDGASVKGTVAGVDSTGALVLADGPRRARFLSGEISLRRV